SAHLGRPRRLLRRGRSVLPEQPGGRRQIRARALWRPRARRARVPGAARSARGSEAGVTPRVLLSWSSGEDSAWALHQPPRQGGVEVVGLLTTFNEAADRVAMHAVRRPLVEAQSAATSVPLWPVELPWPCANADYERLMDVALAQARAEGVTHVAFGDLFLDD